MQSSSASAPHSTPSPSSTRSTSNPLTSSSSTPTKTATPLPHRRPQARRPGTLILADNVIRDGEIIDATSTDPNVQGIRRFLEILAADHRISSTAVQTVGSKGYDGFAIARVLSL